MSYAIKVTIKGKRVFAGNNDVPSKYATKKAAQNDIDKYLKGKGVFPKVVNYPSVSNFK